jgi:hypothetical protein
VKIGCTVVAYDTLAVPHAHTPALQACPGAHAFPHVPQLVIVLFATHVPPHAMVPDGHSHLPALHAWPLAHATQVAPQWVGSVWLLTHAPSVGHTNWLHVELHAPATQYFFVASAAGGQALPHVPQFCRFVCASTHVPGVVAVAPQSVLAPVGH